MTTPHARSRILLALLIATIGCDRLTGSKTLQLSGTLEMTEHSVGARAPGRLATLSVDEGDEVRRGQVLATLDRYDQARRDYERVASVYQQGGATEQAVEQAALAVEDETVVSPVDGVVLVKVHEPGEVLAGGGAVVVIGDRHALWVRVFVPEGLINRVRLNQPALLRFDGLARRFNGHVSFVSPKAVFTPRNVQTPEERVTQAFSVKVTLDEVQPFLRPGVAADVTLQLAEGS